MTLTWGFVKERIRRAIQDLELDPDGNTITPDYSDQDLADFWNDGQETLVTYVSRTAAYTIPSGTTRSRMPDDLQRILWIRYETTSDKYLLQPLDTEERKGVLDDPVFEGLYWYSTHDEIVFTEALQYDAYVLYKAYYPMIEAPGEDSLPIYIPRWALPALVYYCTAMVVERRIVEDADLRRWAARQTDAGKPTDNPFLQVSKYFLERCRQVIQEHLNDSGARQEWPSSYR